MKKILTLVLLTAMLISLCACGAKAPEQPEPAEPSATADIFFTALKTQDDETMATVYAGGKLDLLATAAQMDNLDKVIEDTGLSAVYEEEMKPKLLDFDYELSNEQIDGDKATVDVKIRTYGMGEAFTETFNDFIAQAFIMMALTNATEEEIAAKAAEALTAKLTQLNTKNYEKTATLSMTKVEDQWIVDELKSDDAIVDVLTGGLVSAVNGVLDSIPEWMLKN
ncbi:MAG: hypothetical protein IJH90_08330 [Mogibacterium sp.]|nr:hypothetical protein [Mogibacterium sp.]